MKNATIDPAVPNASGEQATLTARGRRWAERNAFTEVVAKVALHGAETGWPDGHVEVAIRTANEQGELARRSTGG